VLAELGRLLLSPVAGLLPGRRILIAAGAELGPTPFEALPVPGKAGIPLGILNAVVRIPSVGALDALRKRPPAAPGSKILVFADAVFKGDPRSPRPGAGDLARLAFSGEEAASIASAFGSRRVLAKTGFAARKSELTGAPFSASILHLATHAVSSSERPEMSGVWFTELTPSGRPLDAWLSMGEVYNLSLTVDLAVLSACETGVGRATGDGVLSLARGFLLAGANRVIYSQWKIADEGAAVFMREFYSRLAATSDVALSLQGARTALRDGTAGTAWRDPFYWAAFGVEGDTTSLGREAIPVDSR
jgi:CHAT domain-containing protein